MTYKIVQKQIIAEDIKRIDIVAPDIAAKFLPGQFVMVAPENPADALPLTIVDVDERKGTISLIIHETGTLSRMLGAMAIGQSIARVTGPLGRPALIEKYGVVICVATGIGAAQMLPVCRALKKKGNKIIGIIGAKSKKVMMLESQMRVVCDDLFIATNDGSYERRGMATHVVAEMFTKYKVNAVYAIGSLDMMKEAAQMAQQRNVLVRITATPYMACGTGICGSCRVRSGGQFHLACIDGPEFDGCAFDYADMNARELAMKESAWDSRNRPAKPRSDGLKTFMKSFWGLEKNKT